MPQRVTVAKVADIPDGGSVVVNVLKRDVAVFNVNGSFFAVDDFCPHMGASLSGGFVEDGCVTCPWHFWRFRLSDGAWADNPKQKIGAYPIHVVGDDVQLELPDLPVV
ncbi:3-phenylpropionate/cinnamic acid dioxygenase ferredoxin subunit [Gemmata sp. SH-PL17]|uniref:Rieske domain-containing protein n=1 Tax=Gemmata massiliana TaxID=1210884 RepID=A0A6P2CT14_9BACT|nr:MULTISPECIES: Rieske (2Fe-2S) protein [Gemmata]AMV23808.1 3-phenylpropionate/cinnamic acid dioxygenase ferredoxin subunit [Gemmata sp. SH-PL17]VTR92043.1 assimilatory nitrite reductase : Rieske (2Fe-2S) domain protein OS=Pirellula staleyi (strain ATCC 27377 / DSM 6068 / ICPB 4128) GN=Psta_2904 PE=4 SV=1: Rieske [Gemmata massiliana]